jgi:hypothetical protein
MLAGAAAIAGFAITAPARAAASRASDRIEGLLAQMTIEEKAGQLSCFADMIRPPVADMNPLVNIRNAQTLIAEIKAGRIGVLMNGVGTAGAMEAQKAAVEGSRLKIPLIFAADVIHGFRTVFPIPLGESASFDPHLAERTARAAAVEASASGLHWTFAPMVDVARDQRWGRVAEGLGRGRPSGRGSGRRPGARLPGQGPARDDSMLATPKHFAAYGAVTAGLEYNTVELSDATLREVHLPPFQAAFAAGALTTMSAFNDINGVPATANKRLLTDILRGEWGFKGVVISDYTADQELVAHGYAADDATPRGWRSWRASTSACRAASTSATCRNWSPRAPCRWRWSTPGAPGAGAEGSAGPVRQSLPFDQSQGRGRPHRHAGPARAEPRGRRQVDRAAAQRRRDAAAAARRQAPGPDRSVRRRPRQHSGGLGRLLRRPQSERRLATGIRAAMADPGAA